GSGFGGSRFATLEPRTRNQEPGTASEPGTPNPEPSNPARVLLARPVLSFRVPLKLFAVEVNVSQVALAVALGLIVEVLRLRVAALAAGRHRLRPHAIAELD